MSTYRHFVALVLGAGLAACADQLQAPTETPSHTGAISAAAGGKIDTHSRANLIFGDSVLVGGAWIPTGIRGDGRLKNGAAAVHPNNVWDLGSSGSRYVDDLSLVVPLATGGPFTYALAGEPVAPLTGALGASAVLYQEFHNGGMTLPCCQLDGCSPVAVSAVRRRSTIEQ